LTCYNKGRIAQLVRVHP